MTSQLAQQVRQPTNQHDRRTVMPVLTRAQIETFSQLQAKATLKQLGLSTNGTVAVLRDRLKKHDNV